jgi:tRNA(Ile)-lysidine synthase
LIAGGPDAASPEGAAGMAEPQLLTVPGDTALVGLKQTIKTQIRTEVPSDLLPESGLFDLDRLELPLSVRTWRSGDRFEPRGMTGSKKLQDYFVDAKIPRDERERIPLVCDQAGIIWIGGRRQARRGQVDEQSRRLLQITLCELQDD